MGFGVSDYLLGDDSPFMRLLLSKEPLKEYIQYVTRGMMVVGLRNRLIDFSKPSCSESSLTPLLSASEVMNRDISLKVVTLNT